MLDATTRPDAEALFALLPLGCRSFLRCAAAVLSRRAIPASPHLQVHWPPFRQRLFCASVQILSLHQLPTRKEQRPQMTESFHDHVSELSGAAVATKAGAVVTPSFSVELHTTGGFCGLTDRLPPTNESHLGKCDSFAAKCHSGGFCTQVNHTVHCLAAEPDCSLLRVCVHDGDSLVAYAVATLGRMRPGYRCLRLSSPLGTPIELCYLFVHVQVGSETNVWAEAQALQPELSLRKAQIETLRAELRLCEEQSREQTPLKAVTTAAESEAGNWSGGRVFCVAARLASPMLRHPPTENTRSPAGY